MEWKCLLPVFLWNAKVYSRCPMRRFRIGSFPQSYRWKGFEFIFQESIRVNNENDDNHHYDTAFIDSTVQKKNITFPTDAKLHKKIVNKVLDIVHKQELPLRQNYTFVLKRVYRDQRFRNHPKNRNKALWADRKLRTIAGRLVRKLKRNLGDNHDYDRTAEKRFIPFMNCKCNVSAKARNTRNTSSAIKCQSSVPLQASYLEPSPSLMNTTDIRLKHHWNRLNVWQKEKSKYLPATGGIVVRKRSTERKF